MKTKIISFTLIIAYVTIAFHCSTDAVKAPMLPNSPPPIYEDLFPDVTGSYTGFLGHNRIRLNLEYLTNSYHLFTPTGQSSGTFIFERLSDQSYIRFQGGLLNGELFSIESDDNIIRVGPNTLFIKQ